ncbi:tRNA (adenosine(37)-N6)-threonylcarbamoyltransferase complex ATPase subunit type 1 TsaE [Candidatus Uhrbacteria bacterium]|nr:tRNA (adenosine(37)-N6)-threonylcarbamoyltransferase complex ATPase subunit type 1 TsaE [Candidatus Uhrbacteria bacterium]
MITHSAEETKNAAADLAATLQGGEMIALVGDLGAGKTTFVQGLAAALGATARVKSPTFTVMNEYPVHHPTIHRLIHLDLYRFTSADELRALSLEDELRNDTVVVIEWPNALPTVSWQPDVTVTISHGAQPEERAIDIVRA